MLLVARELTCSWECEPAETVWGPFRPGWNQPECTVAGLGHGRRQLGNELVLAGDWARIGK